MSVIFFCAYITYFRSDNGRLVFLRLRLSDIILSSLIFYFLLFNNVRISSSSSLNYSICFNNFIIELFHIYKLLKIKKILHSYVYSNHLFIILEYLYSSSNINYFQPLIKLNISSCLNPYSNYQFNYLFVF